MKCIDIRTFLTEINNKSISTQLPSSDLEYLRNNGYVDVISKDDYDAQSKELADLQNLSEDLIKEKTKEVTDEEHLHEDQAQLNKDEKDTKSFMFKFKGKKTKESLRQKIDTEKTTVESEQRVVDAEKQDIADKDAKLRDYIQKKSAFDKWVSYSQEYVALTGVGLIMLNELNSSIERVGDMEFSDFETEMKETDQVLNRIAFRADDYVMSLDRLLFESDSDAKHGLWPVAIGLAKLEGDTQSIKTRFTSAYNSLKSFNDSNLDRKLMAAEIMTASGMDISTHEDTLSSLEKNLRDQYNVPEKIAVGIAATLLYGRFTTDTTPVDTYPIAKFAEFLKITSSFESAAMLAISPDETAHLTERFNTFKAIFVDGWGSLRTEDTDLASAYLAISTLDPEQAKQRITALVDLLKHDIEFAFVPAAILTSMTAYSPNEVVSLIERSVTDLQKYARDLTRSELMSLGVRMIHGVSNELIQKADQTAELVRIPVQFTNRPMQPAYGSAGFYGGSGFMPFPYPWYWIIISHSSHCSHYGNIGGAHPFHSHGVGGFSSGYVSSSGSSYHGSYGGGYG